MEAPRQHADTPLEFHRARFTITALDIYCVGWLVVFYAHAKTRYLRGICKLQNASGTQRGCGVEWNAARLNYIRECTEARGAQTDDDAVRCGGHSPPPPPSVTTAPKAPHLSYFYRIATNTVMRRKIWTHLRVSVHRYIARTRAMELYFYATLPI